MSAPAIVDADVHLDVPYIEELFPFLSEHWVEHLTQTLDRGASPPTPLAPGQRRLTRKTWHGTPYYPAHSPGDEADRTAGRSAGRRAGCRVRRPGQRRYASGAAAARGARRRRRGNGDCELPLPGRPDEQPGCRHRAGAGGQRLGRSRNGWSRNRDCAARSWSRSSYRRPRWPRSNGWAIIRASRRSCCRCAPSAHWGTDSTIRFGRRSNATTWWRPFTSAASPTRRRHRPVGPPTSSKPTPRWRRCSRPNWSASSSKGCSTPTRSCEWHCWSRALPGSRRRCGAWTRSGRTSAGWCRGCGGPPSDYVREHVRVGIQPLDAPPTAEQMVKVVDQLGSEDLLMYTSDYPHVHLYDADQTLLDHLPQSMQNKIRSETARRLYRFRTARPAQENRYGRHRHPRYRYVHRGCGHRATAFGHEGAGHDHRHRARAAVAGAATPAPAGVHRLRSAQRAGLDQGSVSLSRPSAGAITSLPSGKRVPAAAGILASWIIAKAIGRRRGGSPGPRWSLPVPTSSSRTTSPTASSICWDRRPISSTMSWARRWPPLPTTGRWRSGWIRAAAARVARGGGGGPGGGGRRDPPPGRVTRASCRCCSRARPGTDGAPQVLADLRGVCRIGHPHRVPRVR